jgi:ABC-type glycerol-3-phosphate transport system substrate-binding protein
MDGENIATIVTACVSAIAAITAAYLSSGSKKSSTDTKRRIEIVQARLDERDNIGAEGGFLIPVSNDAMWNDYYQKRVVDKMSSKEAANALAEKSADYPIEIIKEPLPK